MAKVKIETLNEMTKNQLIELATEHGLKIKNADKTRKADLISIIAENVNRTVRGRRNRIKAAVLALIEVRGVNNVTLHEFTDTVLAVYPEWDKANDEALAKKHLSWYKSFYRKNILGQLARPRKQQIVQPENIIAVPDRLEGEALARVEADIAEASAQYAMTA